MMNRMLSPAALESPRDVPSATPRSWARRLAFSLLRRIERGELILEENGWRERFGSPRFGDPIHARVHIKDPATYRRLLLGGTIGAAEAYMEGAWDCQDLTDLIRLFIRNRAAMDRMDSRWTCLLAPAYRSFDRLRRNTRIGSRRNIADHYDLGNDFFQTFLDPTMMYSCAVFQRESASLHEAQIEKLDRICRKLELRPQDHVVEIGAGWGGFAIHAAKHYGCRVTTTTVSRQQFNLADQRIRDAGLEDRIELLPVDYRDLKGRYDKLVSIEMLEAVGYEFYPEYFRKCAELLNPGGRALIQTITIADQEYERAKDQVDFIRRYIFPGGCLPSVTAICETLTNHTPLRLTGLEDLTPHYATTLRRWRENFFDHIERVRELGYPDAFIRRWEYYLCYCEAGFRERAIGLVQLEIDSPA